MNIHLFPKNKRVINNAAWLIAGKVIHMVLSFVVSLISARYLGPSNYGLINYAAAYITFFSSVCTLGINSVLVKHLVDDPEGQGQTMGTTLLLRGVSSSLSALMIVGIVCIVDRSEPITIGVVALCSISMVFQIFDALNYWFQSKLQSKVYAMATLVAYVMISAYKIWLLTSGKSIYWFALSNGIEYLLSGIIMLVMYKKCGGPRFSFSWEKGKKLLRSSRSFVLAGLMVSIYAGTDKLMLKHMLDESAVGYYALAVSSSQVWTFLLTAVIDSVYPVIMQQHKEQSASYLRTNRQLYAMIFYISLTMSALVTVLARPLVELLYGQQYLPAVPLLQIIVWYTAFSYLGVARNAWIVCENKQRYLKYIYIGAAALNVVLNYALIPWLGASGAAIASLTTQIFTAFILPLLIPPLRENGRMMIEAILLKDIFCKKPRKKEEQK